MINDVTFADGLLSTVPRIAPDVDVVLAHLRERRVLAAIPVLPEGAPDAPSQVHGLTVATDAAEQRVLVLRDGVVQLGPTVVDVARDLAHAFGATVEIAQVEVAPPEVRPAVPSDVPGSAPADANQAGTDVQPGPSAAPVAHGDPRRSVVLLTRLRPELAPRFATRTGASVRTVTVDGWTVLVPDRVDHVPGQVWSHADLPVVELWWDRGIRDLTVTTEPGRYRRRSFAPVLRDRATFAPTEADGDAATILTWLGDREQEPGSDARAVLAHPAFAGVSAERFRETLFEPADDAWFGRMLDVLGLPSLAADAVEGRAELPDADVVEPERFGATISRAVDGYLQRVRARRRTRRLRSAGHLPGQGEAGY